MLKIIERVGQMAKKSKTKSKQSTSQAFTNVLDIDKGFLYTKDGLIIRYVRILPISVGLLSDREINTLTKQLTGELSAEREEFSFLAISRPVDVQPLLEQYVDMKFKTDNPIQKELLQKETENMAEFSFGEEVVEKQFYFYLQMEMREDAEQELKKRTQDFAEHFEATGIRTEVLKDEEIIRLCNLVNNPSVVNVEDEDYKATIPILKEIQNG